MSNTEKIQVEKIEISETQLRSILKCLINTIVFQRAIGTPKVKENDSETLNITYPSVKSQVISEKIEQSILKIIENSFEKVEVSISFYETKTIDSWFSKKVEKKIWEAWNLEITKGKKNDNIEEEVVKRMNYIIQMHQLMVHIFLILM
eukprot:gene5181-8787_t